MRKLYTILIVLVVLMSAALLRYSGIGWGLPNETHLYSYHPDENILFGAAVRVNLLEGMLDPGFYNYGSLYIYLVNAAVILVPLFGLQGTMVDGYLAGRFVTLIAGVLTVLFVFLLGRRYGRPAGLLAMVLMAVVPIHVMHSKFIAVDVTAAMFVTLALLFAVRISEGHRLRDYLLAGLFAGLAAGTKYNAGLVLISPIAVHLATYNAGFGKRFFNLKAWLVPVMTVLGFLVSTPGFIFNHEKFMHDFMYELNHARTGHGLVFTDTGSGFVYHLTHSLPAGMGWPLLVLSLAGLVYVFFKRKPADIALVSFFVVYYVVIGAAEIRFSRYIIPLLPVLVIFASRFSVESLEKLLKGRAFAKTVGVAASVVLLLVISYTYLCSMVVNNIFNEPDTRDRALVQIKSDIPLGSTIGFPTIIWFYTPPLIPELGYFPEAAERFDMMLSCRDYMLMTNMEMEWDASFLRKEMPDYVIVSEFEYKDPLRIGLPETKDYFKVLDESYFVKQRFERDPTVFGLYIGYGRDLPHDMSYASPTVLIYERKPPPEVDGG